MKINMKNVNTLLKATEQGMSKRGFSENRKRVARQQGGLRKQLEKVCEEGLSMKKRAAAFMAVENGIEIIALLSESEIDAVIKTWDE